MFIYFSKLSGEEVFKRRGYNPRP